MEINYQSSLFQEVSTEEIADIFEKAFHERTIWEARLLKGGMFNTTYFVEYGREHRKAVLRLGPVNRHLLAGLEENLMEAETRMYSVCHEVGIPCSTVLVCDTSKRIIDRDYMIVEYMDSVVMENALLTEEERNSLYFQAGQYLRRLHDVTGESFGFLSRICVGKEFGSWSEALIYEVADISERLVKQGGMSREMAARVQGIFRENAALLDEIQTPHLLHTDLWEGNILIDAKKPDILAIIDGDRAVYGDTDFEFAASWMEHPELKRGYGGPEAEREEGSPERVRRRELYQMFYCLLEAYVWYAEYNDMEIYRNRMEELAERLRIAGGMEYAN